MAKNRLALHATAGESAPRLGRPRLVEKGEVNRRILRAATALFLRQGFAPTTMDGITEAARVSKATLYAYYPSKEALFVEVVRARALEWEKRWAEAERPPPEDMQTTLLHYATTIIEDTADDEVRTFEELIFSVTLVQPHLKKPLNVALGYRRLRRHLTEDIQRCAENEKITVRNPQRIAEMLFALLYGWYRSEERLRKVSKKERKEYAESAVMMLMASKSKW